MGVLGRLFSKSKPKNDQTKQEPEQAVLVHLKLSDDEMGSAQERDRIFELEDKLAGAISERAAGEFDGNEFGEGGCVLYMYGPNADELFAAVEPVLRASPLVKGGYAVVRYGPPGAREVRTSF
jgi:hypothetical protein